MDRPISETSTWQHTTFTRKTTIPSVGFEPAIPASGRPQTHALDRAATGDIHGNYILEIHGGQGSSGGTVTRYELSRLGTENWGRGGAEIFSSRPDRPCGSPSLLYNGYRVFLGGKAAGALRSPPTTFRRQGLNYSCTCTGMPRGDVCRLPPLSVHDYVKMAYRFLRIYFFFHITKLVKALGAFAKLRKATDSFVMSVCLSIRLSAWNNSATNGRIFMKFDAWLFFENLLINFKVPLQSDKNNGTLYEAL